MMKLKDKLYRKNEKLYRSFGMFDIDKIGSVTTKQFADAIDNMNVSHAHAFCACLARSSPKRHARRLGSRNKKRPSWHRR